MTITEKHAIIPLVIPPEQRQRNGEIFPCDSGVPWKAKLINRVSKIQVLKWSSVLYLEDFWMESILSFVFPFELDALKRRQSAAILAIAPWTGRCSFVKNGVLIEKMEKFWKMNFVEEIDGYMYPLQFIK